MFGCGVEWRNVVFLASPQNVHANEFSHSENTSKKVLHSLHVLEEDKEVMYERVTKGKHAMLLHMVPSWNSMRPLSIMGLQRQTRKTTGLRRFLLAEHCLEIETGRFVRKKRHETVCMACHSGEIGHEMHALSKKCVRVQVDKERAVQNILSSTRMTS